MAKIWEINPDAILIVGLGSQGCGLGFEREYQEFPSVDLPDYPIIDTNGAGDGLAVGFLSSYIFEHKNLTESVMRGQIYARYTCNIKASTSKFISQSQLDQFYEQTTKNY